MNQKKIPSTLFYGETKKVSKQLFNLLTLRGERGKTN